MNLLERSTKLLKLEHYRFADPRPREIELNNLSKAYLTLPREPQFILRMLVGTPDRGICIPKELWWLASHITILKTKLNLWTEAYLPYIYVTVRSGIVQTKTDDSWHVDGFSARYPHVPEQDFIWSDCYPTEYYDKSIRIPPDFNPFKHNLHRYLQTVCTNEADIDTCHEQTWMQIDPYIIHRRPKAATGKYRTFIRISFLPIPIEDDRNTQNPLMPVCKFYRNDIRNNLTDY